MILCLGLAPFKTHVQARAGPPPRPTWALPDLSTAMQWWLEATNKERTKDASVLPHSLVGAAINAVKQGLQAHKWSLNMLLSLESTEASKISGIGATSTVAAACRQARHAWLQASRGHSASRARLWCGGAVPSGETGGEIERTG
jgi:hypothetical protein